MPRKGSPASRAAKPAETIWLSRSPESTASTPPRARPAFWMLFSTAQSSILRSARSKVLSPNISSGEGEVDVPPEHARALLRPPRPPPTRRCAADFQKIPSAPAAYLPSRPPFPHGKGGVLRLCGRSISLPRRTPFMRGSVAKEGSPRGEYGGFGGRGERRAFQDKRKKPPEGGRGRGVLCGARAALLKS